MDSTVTARLNALESLLQLALARGAQSQSSSSSLTVVRVSSGQTKSAPANSIVWTYTGSGGCTVQPVLGSDSSTYLIITDGTCSETNSVTVTVPVGTTIQDPSASVINTFSSVPVHIVQANASVQFMFDPSTMRLVIV